MHAIVDSNLVSLRAHERTRGANMTLGGYHMSEVIPTEEFVIRRGLLDQADGDHLYLISQFLPFTLGRTGLARDVLRDPAPGGIDLAKAAGITVAGIDLRTSPGYEPVIVTASVARGPLLVIDGHHRLTAHILAGRPLDGVVVYVCEHHRLMDWQRYGYVPPTMRLT
ncbi:hypothetical protein [Limnoglobus roseus]|uniref:ParB/Sulfiredoxin domain-containing protein n=1 Tax=Limnoglobus roseus TaxID=2598579 RepID=A0A5C1AN61_9BACT|nr:hypothetical protein [Limnoglobus roseus]QEL20420.1 hypothetical protein PX52LOC_07514 [Limnoglobus roseus]